MTKVQRLYFGATNHTEVKDNLNLKIKTDGRTPLRAVEQYTGLGLDREQVQCQVQSSRIDCRWSAFDKKTNESMVSPFRRVIG